MKQKNPHWIFYVIAGLLLVIAVLLAALLLRPEPSLRQEMPTAPTAPSQIATQPTEVTFVGTLPGEEQTGIPIDCRWLTLYLPQELEGVVTYRVTEPEGGLRVSFYGLVEEQEVELFAFLLSREACDGFRLGELAMDDTQLHIYSYVYEQPADRWSADAYSQIDGLQQWVNEFVAQFHEDPRFVADRQG